MQRTSQSIFAMLIVVAMAFTVLPTGVLAADDNAPPLGKSGTVASFENGGDLGVIDVALGTAEAEVIAGFPTTVSATVALDGDETASPATTGGETTVDIPVTDWSIVSDAYDANREYIFVYQATLDLPEGITLPENIERPMIGVNVGGVAVEIAPMAASSGTYVPLTIASGYNADIVVERGSMIQGDNTGVATVITPTAKYFDGTGSGANYALYDESLELTGGSLKTSDSDPVVATSGTLGLPADGRFDFTNNGQNYVYQLASYTSNNAVQLSPATAEKNGSFVFQTPGAYSEISILGAAGNGDADFNATIRYTDGSTASKTFTAPNWNLGAFCKVGRMKLKYESSTEKAGLFDDTVGGLYQFSVDTDATKLVKQIDFTLTTSTTGIRANLMAVSGVILADVPEAPTAQAATNVTATGFTANWDMATGATKYYLDLSLSSDFSTLVSGYNNKEVGSIACDVSGLTGGTTYYYRVRAANSSGQSTSSNTITAIPTGGSTPPPPSDPSGSSSSDSGSSRQDNTPAPNPWLDPTPAQTKAGEADKSQSDTVRTKSTGTYGVRKDAWKNLKGYTFSHDTMEGNAVQVRVTINNPTSMKTDALVSAHVKGVFVEARKAMFEKWFSNKIRIVHMDESKPWGQDVRIAAKVDLDKMNTGSLYFYSYDKTTNKYIRITGSQYRIDKNGYLHFTTPYAGDIIISENPLERR